MDKKFPKCRFHPDLFPEWLIPDISKFPKPTADNTTVHVENGREDLKEKEDVDN